MAQPASMARLLRFLIVVAVAGVLAGGAGFVAFAARVRELAPPSAPKADAIVVLTGDEERIATGVRLILAGRAKRLLISGVNAATRMPTELKRQIIAGEGGGDTVLKCCVDLGRDAMNTSGNAQEARIWAANNRFHSLIVVTSSYHIPRSLIEFKRAMPGIELVPYPVVANRHLRLDSWWNHRPTARLLLGEYVKLLGASVRFGFQRMVEPRPAPAERVPDPASVTVRAGP